jgi:methenyltetrahydromethanopterin cyclohydrolase
MSELGGSLWPYVDIFSDQPALGCFACQSANWPVDLPGLRGMGSGPACLLAFPEKFPELAGGELVDCAVLVLEAVALPGEEACKALARTCGVLPGRLAVLAAPTSSLAGSTQIAARSIETALHKLGHLGFDLHKVTSGMGRCPVAQPTGDDTLSLGKTNDAMTFGSQVWLSIAGATDAELARLAAAVPAATSPSYGKPFLETLAESGGFYAIDPDLFAPAEIILANLGTGHIHPAGARDEMRLVAALCSRGA